MRILYVGARVVGYRVLESLLADGAQIVGVLTLDETKATATTAYTPFDKLVQHHYLEVRKFINLRDEEITAWARELNPDLGIVVGVSQLIGEDLLAVPPRGFIGMHPTLLPEGRGRAPIPWALIKGLARTGASLFYCDSQADTGDLLAQCEVPVYYEDVSATLGSRTDDAVIELFRGNLPKLAAGVAPRIPQDECRATVWPLRRPEDGVIDWNRSAADLYNWVRALTHPYPGAFSFYRGRRLNIWSARESADCRRGQPGEVLAVLPHGVLVACGQGSLLLTNTTWEGDAGDDTGFVALQPGWALDAGGSS